MTTAWVYVGNAIVRNTARRSWFGEQLELDLSTTPTLSKPETIHSYTNSASHTQIHTTLSAREARTHHGDE